MPAPLALAQADAAYHARDYGRAGPLYLAAARGDDPASAYYNAACSFALAGRRDEAFAALGRAADAGYSDAEQAGGDDDLATLRADSRWAPLLARVAARGAATRAFWDGAALQTPYRASLSDDEKVAGLSKLWAEAKFNFVYFDRLPGLNWDSAYVAFLPRVRAAASTRDYYRVLQTFYAQLQDGHTGVWLPDTLVGAVAARPLVRTALVDGRVTVVAAAPALADSGVAPHSDMLGAEVVAVDGVPALTYAAREVAPYVSASTPQDREATVYGRTLLRGALDRPVALTLGDARGRTAVRRLTRVSAAAYDRAFARERVVVRTLPGRVAYVALNSFGDDSTAEQFEAAFPAIARARALVLDVRENGGGSSSVGYRVLAALADRPFATSQWSTRDYRPAFRAWRRPEGRYTGAPRTVRPSLARHFAGPVVVLTGPRTYSAAEDFVVAFRGMHRGQIVGEATGGSTGQPLMFALPGGGGARVCTKHDAAADGTEFVGVGIAPDVVVRPTVADVRSGRDAALVAAVTALAEPTR